MKFESAHAWFYQSLVSKMRFPQKFHIPPAWMSFKLSRHKTPNSVLVLSSLLEIVGAKSVSGSLYQNPVAAFLQNVCVRVSASAASTATFARSLYEDLLCKLIKISEAGSCRNTCARSVFVSRSPQQDPVGSLVQDLCMRTGARSLYADFLREISVSGSQHQGPAGPLLQ